MNNENMEHVIILGAIKDATANIYPLGMATPIWTGITDSTGKVVKSLTDPSVPKLTYGDYTLEINKCDYDPLIHLLNIPTDTVVSLTAGCSSAITTHEITHNHSLIGSDSGILELISNVGRLDNFTQIIQSGNGTVTIDASKIMLKSGSGVRGGAGYITKNTWILSEKPVMASFILEDLPPIGNGSYGYFGLKDNFSTIDGADTGIYFLWWNNFPRMWSALTRIGYNGNNTDNIVIKSGDIVTIIATSTRAKFYVNGTLVAEHTSSIPTTPLYAGASVGQMSLYASSLDFSVSKLNVKWYI